MADLLATAAEANSNTVSVLRASDGAHIFAPSKARAVGLEPTVGVIHVRVGPVIHLPAGRAGTAQLEQ